jgi:predicted dehydrogenase
VGGGRIIGEGCHFIDLLRHLAGAPIIGIQRMVMGGEAEGAITSDRITISLSFENGSMGTIHYLANGSKSFPKERLEVFSGGKILQIDNFKSLKGFGWKGFKGMSLGSQDKGHKACAAAFVQAIAEGKEAPIAFDEIIEVTEATFLAAGA